MKKKLICLVVLTTIISFINFVDASHAPMSSGSAAAQLVGTTINLKEQALAVLQQMADRLEEIRKIRFHKQRLDYFRKNPMQDFASELKDLILQMSPADIQEIFNSSQFNAMESTLMRIWRSAEELLDSKNARLEMAEDLNFLNAETVLILWDIYEVASTRTESNEYKKKAVELFGMSLRLENKIASIGKAITFPPKAPSVVLPVAAPVPSAAPAMGDKPGPKPPQPTAAPLSPKKVEVQPEPKIMPQEPKKMPQINPDLQKWARGFYGPLLPVPASLENAVAYVQSRQQTAAECQSYSAINAWAIQQLLKDGQQVTSESINKKFAEKTQYIRPQACSPKDLKKNAAELGLSNTYVVTFDEEFPDDIGPDEQIDVKGAKHFDDYMQQLKNGSRDIGYFITNWATTVNNRPGAHWVLAIVRNTPYKHILYLDSKNFPLGKDEVNGKLLKTLFKHVTPEQAEGDIRRGGDCDMQKKK